MPRLIGYPNAHYKTPVAGRTAVNRTGAALLERGCYFIDIPQGDGDSDTVDHGLDNVLKPTTALIAKQLRLVISNGTAADNVRESFVEGEGVETLALVEGTTDIAKGDWLKPTNGQAYLVKATTGGAQIDYSLTTGGADYVYAQALEAFTTDGTGTIRVLLYSSGRRS